MRRFYGFALPLAGLALLAVGGCSWFHDDGPAPVYIPASYGPIMKANRENKTLGMSQEWTKAGQLGRYCRVKVVIVIPGQQRDASWSARKDLRSLVHSQEDDLNELAEYARNAFRNAFQKSRYFQLTDQEDASTLILEFAIVEAVPNKTFLNTAFFISSLPPLNLVTAPVSFAKNHLFCADDGMTAMEVVMRDGQTKEIVSVLAEQSKGPSALLFDAKQFSAYANAHEMIDQWSGDIVVGLDQIKEGRKPQRPEHNGFLLLDY